MQVTRQGALYIKAGPEMTAKVLSVKTPRKTKPGAASRASSRQFPEKRKYPKFKDGQSTADYVKAYDAANTLRNLTGSYTSSDDFFQPLSLNPQPARDDTVIEEMCG